MLEGIIYFLAAYAIQGLAIFIGFFLLFQFWDWSDKSDAKYKAIQDEIDYGKW